MSFLRVPRAPAVSRGSRQLCATAARQARIEAAAVPLVQPPPSSSLQVEFPPRRQTSNGAGRGSAKPDLAWVAQLLRSSSAAPWSDKAPGRAASDPAEALRSRLLFRPRSFGVNELALLFTRFSQSHVPQMTLEELRDYERLTREQSQEKLYCWFVSQQQPVPNNLKALSVVKRLQSFVSVSKRAVGDEDLGGRGRGDNGGSAKSSSDSA